jgi:RsiW-degrading membrane proteinase PrsW (M82 family)
MSKYYGLLRVIRVLPPADADHERTRYPTGWLPEEGVVHVLTQREIIIGRASSNEVVLSDPTISREHARLVLAQNGWHLTNLTTRNIVSVNGQPAISGTPIAIQSQDMLVLGSTLLQFITPQTLPEDSARDVARQSSHRQSSIPAEEIEIVRGRSLQVPPNVPMIPAALGQSASIKPVPADLPIQPEPERIALPWDATQTENLLGPGITLQFALPQRISRRTRWLIVSVCITIFLVSAIITFILNSMTGAAALAQNGVSSIVIALTVPLIPAIGIGLLVNIIDRYEREPWFLRVAAFLWGAVIALPPTLFIERWLNDLIQNAAAQGSNTLVISALQGLTAGATEETIKGLGLLLLFLLLRDEFDNITDGIVYGALIGAGFAMVENFGFFAINSQQFLLSLIIGRILLGWLSHSTFTVCFGIGLGYIRHTTIRSRQLIALLLGYALAIGLHSSFDFVLYQANAMTLTAPGNDTIAFLSQLAIIGDYIPLFLAQIGILFTLVKSLAHERAVIREFLIVEVRNNLIPVNEYALLQDARLRLKDERQVLFQSGFRQWLRVKTLYQTGIGLAFRKWHVSMGDKPKLGFLQPEDAYRQRIQRLRRRIAT